MLYMSRKPSGYSANVNGCDRDKVGNPLDNPARFPATLYSAYPVAMAPDKQTSAVQDTTVLQRRDYTKDGMTAPTPPKSSLYLIF